jgi:hypothetical protein
MYIKSINDIKRILRYIKIKLGFKIFIYKEWEERQFYAPSPHFIKQIVLLRNGLKDATWIETGTYTGSTTDIISKYAKMVISIEPEPELFRKAKNKFKKRKNVVLINDISENSFPKVLPSLNGNVCFWLDGHYSSGNTFKGPQDTPIIDELNYIQKYIPFYLKVVVMVDDVRCFNPLNPDYIAYPTTDFLVDWARKNTLFWHIEHDIFIARSYPLLNF